MNPQGEPRLEQALQRVCAWFADLRPEGLADVERIYAPHARFTDPWSDIHGIAAIEAMYRRMFRELDSPRFVIGEQTAGAHSGFVTWTLHFRGRYWPDGRIEGVSHLHFDPDGRVRLHRDYWDAAGAVYEALPALGPMLRLLRRRMGGEPVA